MTMLSHDAAFHARETEWERQEQDSGLECWVCHKALSVGEEEAGDWVRADSDPDRIACWACWQAREEQSRCEWCLEVIDFEATEDTGCLVCLALGGAA